MGNLSSARHDSGHLKPMLIGLALAWALALAGCGGDDGENTQQDQQASPPLTSEELLAPGPYVAGSVQLKLADTSRPTAPNDWFPGAASRMFSTYVWYPAARADDGPFPLIVYSHGFMSYGTEAKYLAEHLATYGYIVVCPTFPLTWFFAFGGPNIEDVVNQPGDVSFMIDTFLGFNEDPGSAFYGMVDGSRIGVAGLSLGGMTTSLVTYHPYLRDPRIDAAATLAGPASMFNERFYQDSQAPLLALFGDIDAIVDYATNGLVALEMAAPKITLATFRGATHTGFSYAAYQFMENMDNPDLLGCKALMAGLSLDVDFPALLGGEDAGVVDRYTPLPCSVSPLPTSIRPSRQEGLTILAVLTFFDSRFAPDPLYRSRALRFLHETMAEENPEVNVQ
jgi:dienelactone hydrolase